MVERIDGQKCEPDHGPDRAAVLARRVVGSLPARLQSTQPDRGVYRKQPGFRRAGLLCGALALVQCRLAGETACPTKTCQSTGQNVETPAAGPKPCPTSSLTPRRVAPGHRDRKAAPGQQIYLIGPVLRVKRCRRCRGERSYADDIVAVGQIVDGKLDLRSAKAGRVLDGVIDKNVGQIERI